MLIATVGSSPSTDKLLAQQMKNCAHLPLKKWLLSEDTRNNSSNIKKRSNVLSLLSKPSKNEILLMQSIEFAEEAEIIRDSGGFIWHIENNMSNYIPMLPTDMLVTTKLKKSGTYLAVHEALHNCRLKRTPTRKMPKPNVPWYE